jgi:tetrahydromethanopterin S-methyltransferase subunit B
MDAGQSHDCAQIQLDAIRERLNQIEEVIDHLLLSLPPQERS